MKFESLISHSNFADRYQYRRSVQSFDEVKKFFVFSY
jgi:hypothetical protein